MVFTLLINALLSIYGIVYKRSLVKKLIGLTILSDTVFVSIILVGFIFTHPIVPPVYSSFDQSDQEFLVSHASDPLPQALVLTGIVIGLAVNALIAFSIIQTYTLSGTVDAKQLVETLTEEVTE
ncbi:MAG: sodium:proton antiporter [Desulfurococcaceae archaeon]